MIQRLSRSGREEGMRNFMSSLFQIYEDDLVDLERILPSLADAMTSSLTPRLKTQLRRVQKILSDVRWNYGPPSHVETVADGADEADQAS
jgi:Tfp pilus assembly ATPase PilU